MIDIFFYILNNKRLLIEYVERYEVHLMAAQTMIYPTLLTKF